MQQERLAAIRDNWIAIGLSTGCADRQRAEAGVRLAYRRAGLSDAVRMIWALSPISGALVAASLARRANRPRIVADAVKPDEPMLRNAFERVTPAVAVAIRRGVVEPIATHVTERVWKPINREVLRSVRRPASVPAYGQHEAPWLAFADILGQSGIDVSAMEASAEIAQSCGWWWPFDDVCVLSERYSRLALDEDGRLHAAHGPAVVYPDGWSIYAWHGVVIDASIVRHPELITVAQIQGEANAAVRRVLLERYGYERYVEHSGADLRLLQRCADIGGAPSAANQAPPIETDWVAAILRGQYGRQVRWQDDRKS